MFTNSSPGLVYAGRRSAGLVDNGGVRAYGASRVPKAGWAGTADRIICSGRGHVLLTGRCMQARLHTRLFDGAKIHFFIVHEKGRLRLIFRPRHAVTGHACPLEVPLAAVCLAERCAIPVSSVLATAAFLLQRAQGMAMLLPQKAEV